MKILFLFSLLVTFFASASDEQFTAVDELFSDWEQSGSPGAALGIIRDGEFIYAKGFGFANLEHNIPIDANSVFRIGSTSKQFTAACIVLLEQKGQLKFSDTLDTYFPSFPDYAKRITVAQLLHHTSGIRDYLELAYLKGLHEDDFYQDKDILAWLIQQKELNIAPGEEFFYSNSGYWLLGQIVNQVSGMSMAKFAQEEIFKPLGMNSTHFHDNKNRIVPNRAAGYAYFDKDDIEIWMTTLQMIGDGGIFTTINDIKKWDDAFYQSKVLNRDFWEKMLLQGTLNNGEEIDYASGLLVGSYKGLNTISHAGSFVGFRADIMRFPEQKFTVAIFANRSDANPTALAEAVADVFLADEFVSKPTEVSKPLVEALNDTVKTKTVFAQTQLLGVYMFSEQFQIALSLQDGKIRAKQSWNGDEYVIVATDTEANEYQIEEDDSVKFTFSELKDEKTQVMTIFEDGVATDLKRTTPFDASGIVLSDFVGDYYSEELDVLYRLRVVDENIVLSFGSYEQLPLWILSESRLTYEGNYVDFERNGNSVESFKLNTEQAKNISFVKRK
jgi:CubicO group peptidase (beta-lactamase class C family)